MQSLLSNTVEEGRGSVPRASCSQQTASDRRLDLNIAVNQLYFSFVVFYTHVALKKIHKESSVVGMVLSY